MAELLRAHPLEAWSAALAALPATVRVTVEPYVAAADVRLAVSAAGNGWARHLGVTLPTVANTWVPTADGRAVWLGPDEWLVTSTTAAPWAWEAELAAAARSHGGTAVDVSAQRIGLRLRGARVRDVLAKGCSLDLHPRVFGTGACAQTTLGQAGIVLLALSDDGDDLALYVRASFAGYLAGWLLDAALEFTTDNR